MMKPRESRSSKNLNQMANICRCRALFAGDCEVLQFWKYSSGKVGSENVNEANDANAYYAICRCRALLSGDCEVL